MALELLSPAGDFPTALAAFDAGADAVYCGLAEFSARAFAKNFSLEDLGSLLRVARARGKKVYVTLNTVIDEADIPSAVRLLADLDELRPDALIVQDLGLARLVRAYFPELTLHASTQLVAHNLEGVLALKELGFTRVVLARELSLKEISSLVPRAQGLEFECFIHGALCYSLSGLCLFGALEKGRSGNRGRCPYCCREAYEGADGQRTLAFSMKDLRLGDDVKKLAAASVASLKIEGRMKSALYVASVTRYYRQILDASTSPRVTAQDLETVFSRRTTELYLNGPTDLSPIDPVSLGHLGAPIGTVKRVTKDREGRAWVRFHTARALEKHDGLQFSSGEGEKCVGFGIAEMRPAISRTPVFEVAAGTDVEILLPPEFLDSTGGAPMVRSGAQVYCSMSNAVKRMFPAPSYRPSDYPGDEPIDFSILLEKDCVSASATGRAGTVEVFENVFLSSAKNPEKTEAGVRKAFSKLGGTPYALRNVTVSDPWQLFVPMSVLNDLRRDLVQKLDALRDARKRAKLERALADDPGGASEPVPAKRLKIRLGQPIPAGAWDEVIVAVNAQTQAADLPETQAPLRLALPVYTPEGDFQKLRLMVKRLLRAGHAAWEASDLATLRLLRALGVTDVTADWTLYAFNASALKTLADLGVLRVVASPENTRENLQFLAESGRPVEFLVQQATPLFISVTPPAAVPAPESGLAVFARDALWITTKRVPRAFAIPAGVPERIDLSWNPS